MSSLEKLGLALDDEETVCAFPVKVGYLKMLDFAVFIEYAF